MYKFKKQHNNLTDEEWRKLCFSPFVNTQVKKNNNSSRKGSRRRYNQKGKG